MRRWLRFVTLGLAGLVALVRVAGVVRMATSSMPGQPHEPADVTRIKAAYASSSLKAVVNEANGLDSTFAEVAAAHQLGDRPLFVLTAGAPSTPDELKAMQIVLRLRLRTTCCAAPPRS